MKGQANTWWPGRIRRQRELEQRADALIRAADRKPRASENKKQSGHNATAQGTVASSQQPRRWRLGDLRELRRMGRVP